MLAIKSRVTKNNIEKYVTSVTLFRKSLCLNEIKRDTFEPVICHAPLTIRGGLYFLLDLNPLLFFHHELYLVEIPYLLKFE